MYKNSKYNFHFYNENNELLIFNTRTQNRICISREYAKNIEKLLCGKEDEYCVPDKIREELVKREFLIPEDTDELRLLKMKHNEAVFGTDSLTLEILPTNDCNLRCVYCFENPVKSRMSQETENRIIKFLKRNIPKIKEFRLDWFGGEPLLEKDIMIRISKEANQLCKKYGVPMYGTISTNGVLLDLDTFNNLIQNRIIEFQICIDGPREFHNSTRPHDKGKDSYEMIINNLKEIKENVKVNYFRIALRCNVTPHVIPYLERHINELYKIFGNDNRFYIMFQGVNDWGGERIKQTDVLKKRHNVYQKYYNMAKNIGLTSAEKLPFAPFKYCPGYKKNGFVVNYDGNIYKCSLILPDEKNNIDNKIGYLNEAGNAVIDENKLARWLVSDPLLKTECEKCIMVPVCMGGYCPYKKNVTKTEKCNLEMKEMLVAQLECARKSKQLEILGEGK